MKRLIAILFLAGLALAQQSGPASLPVISGNGTVTRLAQTGTVRWITFISPPTNSSTTCGTSSIAGCPRIGDSSISTSRGYFLTPGTSAYVPESPGASRIALSTWYYLVQSGDTLVIQYGQ